MCHAVVVTVVAAAGLLLSPAAGPGRSQAAAGPVVPGWAEAARFHKDRVEQAGIVGSSVFLVRDGKVVAQQQVGYQDLNAKRPVDADTIFHWASITKTFTGIAIMQLRDRKLLSLDDPIVKYVPEIREVHDPFGDISQVTIRQLMSHTAGFRAGTWPWGGDEDWHPFEPTRWEQVVAMFPYTKLLFPPGSKYSYSNPGIIFLGKTIERLTGDDFEVYVTKNVLMPLGMTGAFFDRAPYHLLRNRSHSYYRTEQGLKEGRFDFDTGITVSNGGLNAPLGDMSKYLAFLLGDERRAAEYDGVLARASLEEMFTPVARAADGEGGTGDDVRMGLSFFIERHQGVEVLAHSGSQGGFLSHIYLHRPSRTAYVIAYNTEVRSTAEGEVTRKVDAEIRDVMLQRVFSINQSTNQEINK
ncbi:MAG: class A beta-lactamase-related serine hydrolase [Candidatus Rokuibacteriota bacterium]|nr:MAG: class A beta-lactamase-related serine hydrolase [Candidatus Rokubacteria bacterium]